MSAPSEQDWAAALGALTAAQQPVLLCHVSPDGDALGSMLAALLALRARGVAAIGSWGDDPQRLPAAYAELPGLEYVVPVAQVPDVPEVIATFDTGSSDRLGLLAGRLDACRGAGGEVIVVDHHVSNTRYGSVHLIDAQAAATAVLVDELVQRLGVPLSADIAAPLYTGLITDTGSFKYAATTASVHSLAARLLDTGIRHDEISRRVWDTTTFSYVQLLGRVLGRAVLEPHEVGGLGLVWTECTARDLTAAELGLDAVEGIIDVIRTAQEAEVAVVLKAAVDDPAGTFKVSTRSKGQVDVGAICVALGGGGHRFAAGFTSTVDAPTTMARLRTLLADAPHLSP